MSGGSAAPLIILGFDVGDPDSLMRWAGEGYLPTLASIMARGCWGSTGGADMLNEHSVWPSLISGVSVSQHGYYHFRQLIPGTYDLRPVTGPDFALRPFWHYRLPHQRLAIVDVPEFTPQPDTPGFHLANWTTYNALDPPSMQPSSALDEVRRIFGPPMPLHEHWPSSPREDRRFHRQLLQRVQRQGLLCRTLLERQGGPFDLIAMVFSESHPASHQFWPYQPPQGETALEPADAHLVNATRDVFQAIDREMGIILAPFLDRANVVVLGSVGMKPLYPMTGLTEAFCRQLGYQATPAGARSFHPAGLMRSFLPESWRIAVSRRFPRSVRERLLSDQFRTGTDWTRTAAFSIPSFFTGYIRVNLEGREPMGVVTPGDEYERVLVRIETDLTQLVDPHTGACPVEQAVRTGEVFEGGVPAVLPDLFVIWKPASHFIQRLLHPRAVLTQRKPEFFRNSDHSSSGFWAMTGPSIAGRGPLGAVDLLDLAPTFLSLMGAPVPPVMRGRVLDHLLRVTCV
jgi:predicted AlkP superfamily phosphohydrolase/phosphomutase